MKDSGKNIIDTKFFESSYRAPFTSAEYARRLEAVRKRMRKQKIDALLTTSLENIYYLIGLSHQGYFTFTMLVIPAEGRPILICRAMEHVTVAAQAPNVIHAGYTDTQKPTAAIVRVLRKLSLTSARIGIEKNTIDLLQNNC